MVQLTELIDAIKKEAGFEVYVHSAGRADLNDWTPEDADNYTRAIHNLRNPTPMSISDCEVKDAIGGIVGCKTDFGVVAYGLLPSAEAHIAQFRHTFIKTNSLVEANKAAMEVAYKMGTSSEISYKGSQELSQIINTDNKNKAYFVSLTISADIFDVYGRGPMPPALTIIGDHELSSEIVEYLENNPQDYMKFIKLVLPQNQFPCVNNGIIARAKPAKSIVFLDANKIDKTRRTKSSDGSLEDWVYIEYGKEVAA
jgi:hypothetical protein